MPEEPRRSALPAGTARTQPVLRATALTVLCGLLLLFGAGPALAHTRLLSSDPADGASLADAPDRVSLVFNEAMQAGFNTITVVGPNGAAWQTGEIAVDGATVSVGLRPLGPAGRYEIGYRVVSDDGHPVSGSLAFTLTDPGPGAAAALTSAPPADPAPSVPPAALETGAARQHGRGSSPRWSWSAVVWPQRYVWAGDDQGPPRTRPEGVLTHSAAVPRIAGRLAPALWAGLAVGAAVLASVLAGALASVALPVLLGTSITRSGMSVAGVACVGLALLGVLLPLAGPAVREAAAVQARADRAIVALSGTWLVLVLLGIAFRAADAFGRPVTALRTGDVGQWMTELAAGRGMVLTAGCAAVVLGCTVVRLRKPEQVPVRIPLVAALLGVLTPAVTGHASSAPDHQLAVVTAALHVGAAALWVGGLGAVLALVARRRNLLAATLPRFSSLAGFCVVAVALTGVLNAQVRLESWAALLTTGYGRLVVAKAVCLVLLGGLGGLARRRLAAGRTPVLRWAGLEVALMAVTLGLAAALTQTA